jgi:hypothetical protein
MMLFVMCGKNAYADPNVKEEDVEIVVMPLLHYNNTPIHWNFNGVVGSYSYYNIFLGQLRDFNGVLVTQRTPTRKALQPSYAATGCVNTAIGAIMYAQAYPNAAVIPGKNLLFFHTKRYSLWWGSL